MIATRIRSAICRMATMPGALVRRSAFAIAALVAGWLLGVFAQPSPLTVIDAHEVDGVAVRGGVLDLTAIVDQRQLCVTSVRRWLWRDAPGEPGATEWIFLPGAPFRPPTPIGRDRYTLKVPVPAFTPAGIWHYLGEPTDDCSPFRTWFGAYWPLDWLNPPRKSSDILVRIDDPTWANPAEIVAPPGVVTVIPSTTAAEAHR